MENPKGSLPYRLIYELGNAFASRLELVPLIELVTSKCREVLDADSVAVMLLDAASQELYFPYFSDRDPKVAERLGRVRVPVGKGIAGEVFQTGRSVRIDNVSSDRHFYSGVDKKTGFITRSVLAAPLIANEVCLGVIEAVNPRGRDTFSVNESEPVGGAGGQRCPGDPQRGSGRQTKDLRGSAADGGWYALGAT